MNSPVSTQSKSSKPSQRTASIPATEEVGLARVARGTATHEAVSEKPTDGMFSEAFHRKWGRRLVTIPALVLLTAIYGALLPALAVYAIVRDTLRGRRAMPLLRFHVYIFSVLFMQCLGLLLLQCSWIYTLFMSPERRAQVHLNVEIFFIPKTIALAEIIYGMDIEIENIDCCKPGPILLFSRHASILDTILPIKLLGQAHGMGMRIVQKAELLWNPVVDVASHRMPRAFVKRGTGNAGGQAVHMQHLLKGITDNQALVVFPEGSRFSPAKKARIVEKLEASNPAAAKRAQELEHVLPARPAGSFALIDARPDIDVVFLAHTGLEGANTLQDFVSGALYKKTLKMKFWRVPASEIPQDSEARNAWLHKEWSKLDRWVDENRD